MSKVMVSLVGEQPIPNLIPARYYAQAHQVDKVVFVYTTRTSAVKDRMKLLFSCVDEMLVDAYDIGDIEKKVTEWITTQQHSDVIFNLTGGTKPMMLAAYRLAERLKRPFIYFQTEGRQSRIYHYGFTDDIQPTLVEDITVPGIISIREYVQAHAGTFMEEDYPKNEGGLFEEAVCDVLKDHVDEIAHSVKIGGALDIDIIPRIGNRVGVVEAKKGSVVKKGIDQLNTAAGREYFGIYTSKFLVMGESWNQTHSNLRELAEARNITVIELPSYGQCGVISPEDQQKLIDTIQAKL